jgi:hypothetical protein
MHTPKLILRTLATLALVLAITTCMDAQKKDGAKTRLLNFRLACHRSDIHSHKLAYQD